MLKPFAKFGILAFALSMSMNTSVAMAQTAFAQTAFSDPSEQTETSGNGLVAVEGTVDGGTIPVGSTAQVITRFRNE